MIGRARIPWWLSASLCAFVLWAREAAADETPGVTFAKAPAWVAPLDTEGVAAPEAWSGIEVIAVDNQGRLVDGDATNFSRNVYRVTTELGAKTLGEQKYVFMPPYQTLVLHTLEIRRAGQAISALKPGAVQVLRREAKAESGVYDGARTAVVVLSDLRVGDVVVSEHSLHGMNPVIAGHATSMPHFQAAFAVGRLRQRLFGDRHLEMRLFGGAPNPAARTEGNLREYTWQLDAVKAMRPEAGTPSDFDQAPWAQLTDFRGWGEVASWGRDLFVVPTALPKSVGAWRDELAEESDPAERVRKALRMVQDRVRYLSLSFAESSHRPTSPDLVLERGFGDCKDKSLLLVTLLRSLDVAADVALVSSTQGELLPRLLPSIASFDHAIVTLELGGVRYWLDPARLYQRGTLADVSVRGFRFALRLAPGVNDLEEIEEPADQRASVDVLMRFDIKQFGRDVTLHVSSTFVGLNAEAIRAAAASGSPDQLSTLTAAQILKVYPRALRGEARVEDREAVNEVVVHQSFELDADDWIDAPDGRKALSMFPPWLAGQLPTLPADRRNPVALAFPFRMTHRAEARLPLSIANPLKKTDVESPVFDLGMSWFASGNEFVVRCNYDVRARRLNPEQFAEYRSAMTRVMRALDLSVAEPKIIQPASRLTLFTVLGLWSVVLLVALWYVELREPFAPVASVRYRPELAGRQGWLALLGFGVTVGPLRITWNIIQSLAAYSAEQWTALTSPSSPTYDPGWEPLLATYAVINATLLVASCYSAYLFWAGRRSFPLVCSVVLGVSIVTIVLDAVVSTVFAPLAAAAGQATARAIQIVTLPIACAWFVYLFRSERVKATFLPAPVAPEPQRT